MNGEEINMLVQLFQFSANDPSAANQIQALVEENPFRFLINCSSIVISGQFDNITVIKCAIINMNRVIAPSIHRNINTIRELFLDLISEEEQELIKQAFCRGLLYEEISIRSLAALGIAILAQVLTPLNMRNNRKWLTVFNDLKAIFDEFVSQSIPASVGVVMAFREILDSRFTLNLKFRALNDSPAIIAKCCLTLLGLESSYITDSDKCQVAQCLAQAIHFNNAYYSKEDTLLLTFQLIIENLTLNPSNELTSALFRCLYEFIRANHDIMASSPELLSTVLSNVASYINKSPDTTENSQDIIVAIQFITDISKYEAKQINYFLKDSPEKIIPPSIIRAFAGEVLGQDENGEPITMIHILLNLFLLQQMDLSDEDWNSGLAALKCLKAIGQVTDLDQPYLVEICSKFFYTYFNTGNLNQQFASLCAAQVIIGINSTSSKEFFVENIPGTEANPLATLIEIAVCSNPKSRIFAMTVLLSLMSEKNELSNDNIFLEKFFEVINTNIYLNQPDSSLRAMVVFHRFVNNFSKTDYENFLSNRYDSIIEFLFYVISNLNPNYNDVFFIETFGAFSDFIIHLPSVNLEERMNLLGQTIINDLEQKQQQSIWSSPDAIGCVVYAIGTRISNRLDPNVAANLIGYLMNILANSTESNGEMLLGITTIIRSHVIDCDQHLEQLYQLLMQQFENHNPQLVQQASIVISDIFKYFRPTMLDKTVDTVKVLCNSLINSDDNQLAFYILYAISVIFDVDPMNKEPNESNEIGPNEYMGLFYEIRDDIMVIVDNLVQTIPFLITKAYREGCREGDIGDFKDIIEIESAVFLVYRSILFLYSYETSTNQDTKQRDYSPFLLVHKDKFLSIAKIAFENKLVSDNLLLDFLKYLRSLIIALDKKINVEIHKPAFTYFLNKAFVSPDPNVFRTAKSIQVMYDNC